MTIDKLTSTVSCPEIMKGTLNKERGIPLGFKKIKKIVSRKRLEMFFPNPFKNPSQRVIVNFPFLDGDVPRRASYGVYISQRNFIRFARVCNHVTDFNARNKCLKAKLLQQG